MQLRKTPRALAFAASALSAALCCVCASTPLFAKTNLSPKQHVQPPKVHLIRCAEALKVHNGWPCWPDPGMLRLDPRPHLEADPPEDPPQFVPGR